MHVRANNITVDEDVTSSVRARGCVKHYGNLFSTVVMTMSDRGIYLGRSPHGDVTSGEERSALVIGPSRSGKTSSIIIPNLLSTTRSSIVTSTKDDVVRAVAGARRDAATLLFDPSGTIETPPGVHRVGYSPLRQARQWDGAVLVARTLVDVSRRRHLDAGESHWIERAGALVAPLLHASSLMNETIGQVGGRVDARRGDDALALLSERYGPHHPATSLLTGVLATEERELSGIWSSASGLFSGLRTEAARTSAREGLLDLDAFLSGPHQLHVVSPSQHQAVSVPLIAGMIDEVVQATYQRHHAGAQLLLALDELANVAPLPRLASIVSEGGGQGVVTLGCLQDLSQARSRWGESADGFLSLFATTVILPGIADRRTLESVAQLAGREFVATPSMQFTHRGKLLSQSRSFSERDRMTPAAVAQGRRGHALGLDATKVPQWIALTPWFRDPRWRPYLERDQPSRDNSRSR